MITIVTTRIIVYYMIGVAIDLVVGMIMCRLLDIDSSIISKESWASPASPVKNFLNPLLWPFKAVLYWMGIVILLIFPDLREYVKDLIKNKDW